MIEHFNGIYGLHGEGFSCLLRINEHGILELLHFGEPLSTADAKAFITKPGLGWGESILLDETSTESCADSMPLAWSGAGRGDYRESPMEFGGKSSDFRFVCSRVFKEHAHSGSKLPGATGECETLEITMAQPGAQLFLYFSVFGGVLVRKAVLKNTGKNDILASS